MAYGTVNADLMTTSDGVSSSGLYGFKNRIINGAMVINQRGFSGNLTTLGGGQYTLDRWFGQPSQDNKFSISQTPNATETGYATRIAAGFTNYLAVTSQSAYSVISTDYFAVRQQIEGFNVADLAWGTANAKTVTLSFLVYSSLTGTFGGTLQGTYTGGTTRTYPFSYTISSANTWTPISITIAGDQSGTWATNNSLGISVAFGLGCGSSFSASAGAWTAGNYVSATGAVSVVGTNGATFYITGVQLEKGSTATSFDYRPYGTELQLCQRYYWRNTGAAYSMHGSGIVFSTTQADIATKFSVSMRAIPTVSLSSTQIQVGATTYAATGISGASGVTTDMAFSRVTTGGTMTVGYGAILTNANSSTGYLDASAEL